MGLRKSGEFLVYCSVPGMKVLFLVKSLESASTRYRVLQYLPYLRKSGIEPTVHESPPSAEGWGLFLSDARSADLVLVQRKRLPLYALLWLRYLRKPLIYDIDDAVMFRDSRSGNPRSMMRAARFRRMARASRLVIAGNSFLKGQAEPYARRVEVLPTPIDAERYRQKEYRQAAGVNIGWIGERKTLPYLADRREVWEALGRKYPNVTLTIISNEFFQGDEIRVVPRVWSQEREIEDLMSLDIGVMPLTDDPWSRGKCGFKILQYFGVGVPAVCSPVGANRDIVEDGACGFFAEEATEWVEKLSLLIENAGLRTRMGQEGRRRVLKRFTVQRTAPLLVSWLTELARR